MSKFILFFLISFAAFCQTTDDEINFLFEDFTPQVDGEFQFEPIKLDVIRRNARIGPDSVKRGTDWEDGEIETIQDLFDQEEFWPKRSKILPSQNLRKGDGVIECTSWYYLRYKPDEELLGQDTLLFPKITVKAKSIIDAYMGAMLLAAEEASEKLRLYILYSQEDELSLSYGSAGCRYLPLKGEKANSKLTENLLSFSDSMKLDRYFFLKVHDPKDNQIIPTPFDEEAILALSYANVKRLKSDE